MDPKPGEPGHYQVFQLKKKEVDGDYTPSKGHSYPEFDEESVHHNEFRDKKDHRREVAEAEWADYPKHQKARTKEEAIRFSYKEAQYLPDVNIKELEKLAIQKGKVVTSPNGKNVKYFFFKSDRVIGYDQGKATHWIRAEISSGTYHGHPMNTERLKKYNITD